MMARKAADGYCAARTNVKAGINRPKNLRPLARAVVAIRRDSLATGTAGISMAPIDREVAAVRRERKRKTDKH